ncbi:SIS domain-containing protein [Fredinandcohnia onubensis]|uniref:SIS domain-containing protein n=1 Tax=Fredinandcohnia onubensis TaxID=1571209 RepID=UPI000C0BCCD0|nr:SIS domain-containing protein [Fredinandcohnia onubensis]
MKQEHVKQISDVVKAVKEIEVKNFYFVACGGSMASLGTGDYFVDRELDIPTRLYTSNEFVHSAPKGLGKGSVVILRSHSGTTPETVEAARFAREQGALTIAISMDVESPLCKAAEYTVHYNYKDGSNAIDGEVGIYFSLVFQLLQALSPNEKYERVLKQLENLETLLDTNKKQTIDRAFEWGKENKREKLIYTMGSGVYFHQAYSFTSCLLMEMLWIHSNAIHTGEFFHGPFEITDDNVPFLIVKGEGANRPLDERAITFAQKFSKNVEVVDVAELDFTGIDKDLKEYFGPAIVGAVLRQYADGLAEHTGHPLSVRRYMWKMEY